MIYTRHNAAGATVHVVESGEKLDAVMSVDTDVGEVECAVKPYIVDHTGDAIVTFKRRFRSIHPIFAGRRYPLMFHCYGERA